MNNEYKNEIAFEKEPLVIKHNIAYEKELLVIKQNIAHNKELLAKKRRYHEKYLRFAQRYTYVQNEWFYRVDKIAIQKDYQELKKKHEHLKELKKCLEQD